MFHGTIRRGRRTRRLIFTLLLSICAASAAAATGGLLNPGFEDPIGPDGSVAGWTLSAVELARVTDGDDGSDFAVYAEEGLEVPPLVGGQSLLVGRPDFANGQQSTGANQATSLPFAAAGGDIALTLRVFSFEARGDDELFFRILNPTGMADLSAVSYAFTQVDALPGSRPLEEVTDLCGDGPSCALVIDIGKNNSPLFDSGIYELHISGLPTDTAVQIEVGVLNTNNSSKATWMYVDNVIAPPEAIIRVNPGDESPALEGDFVVADCLQSTGTGITCDWSASGGGWATPRIVQNENIAFFWFPDDTPTVTIELTVTAADGQLSTASKTLNILNAEPAVNAINVEVLAGTSGETICRFADPGIGRYDDDGLIPGSEEAHFLISGGDELPGARQESEASFSSGFFPIAVSAGGNVCQIQDGDGAIGSDSFTVVEIDPAELTTRLGDEGRIGDSGGNETIASAHTLAVDWKYLAVIGDPQDIDVYRIVGTEGNPLEPGTELVVSLEGQPVDYDLLVLSNGGSTEASPFFNAPFFNAPFFNAPFFNAPFFNAPFFNAQFNSIPFFNAPFFNAPFFNAPFFNAPVKKSPFFNAGDPGQVFNRNFSDLPLSDVGLAAPDGSNVSGSDISVAEVGSLSLNSLQASPGISLKALSAEPGTDSEKVLVKIAPGETEIYVAVVGNGLGFSATQPYALTIEASTPPSQKALLAETGFCAAERDDPADLSSPPRYQPSWSAAPSGSPTSGSVLILTQKERFQIEQRAAAAAAVGAGEFLSESAYWSDFWAKIDEYAAAVDGTVVSIDGSLFQAADEDPCSVATRNALVESIRDTYIINQPSQSFRNGTLDSVVIVGGQNIIPPLAVPDETVVGNEKDFTTDLWVRPGTPLAVATAEGYNLTDAVYGDLVTTPFRGRTLYLEDRPVARFVERPEEIAGDIDAFFAIQAGTAPNFGRLAYGYDFFCDGTSEVADLLGVDLSNVGLPCAGGSAWTAQDLTDDWLNGGVQMCTASAAALPLEIAAVNAHMTTYGALSARGFLDGLATGNYDDVVPAADAQQCLDGTLTMSIGCHSGLNIPDGWALSDELNLPFDPALDWVEQLGFMVAPRGYGLGDNTVSNRGTEGLMTLLVDELNQDTPLGWALVNAKRRYVMGLRELDVHDEDSLINLALFAPPQLTFPSRAVAQLNTVFGQASANATESPAGTLALTITESRADGSEDYLLGSATGPASLDLIRYDDLNFRGAWFEIAPGDAQATYGRSLQPVTLPFEDRALADAPDQTRVHGVALVSRTTVTPCPINSRTTGSCNIAGVYEDLGGPDADGLFDFNPVFPLPQHDWLVYEDDLSTDSGLEPFSCVEALVPTQLGIASTLDTSERVSQSLIIGPGQFRCETGTSTDQVHGQQRLFSSLSMAVLHPAGESTSAAQAIDGDFDPPQVTQQSVIADPVSGDVTISVAATDALTGGTGIREIIALVYWNEGESNASTGVVESYSFTPDGALTADPFTVTAVLENAGTQRVALQFIDGAGNLTQKSEKGTLIRPVEVEILEADISITDASSVSISIGDFCELASPTVSYSIDGGSVISFTIDNPPAGVTVSILPNGPCDATLIVEGIDFAFSEYGDSGELTVEIRAPGAVGSDTEVVFAPPVITITLPILPSGTVGIDYPDQTFSATGGVGGFIWSVSAGSLPPSLSLGQIADEEFATLSGDITGFAGSPYEFTLTVTDAGGISESVELSIEIYPPPIVIEPIMLPNGTEGTAYSAALSATGGSGTASWLVTTGTLPSGLVLNAETGLISGTPAEFGEFPLSVTLDDANENVVDISVELNIVIYPPPLLIDPITIAEGQAGTAYAATLSATGGSGSASWFISGGTLPNGLTLDAATGLISGTPVEFGEFPLTVTLDDTDTNVTDAIVELTLIVFPPPLVIESATLPDGRVGDAYSATLTATGGSGSAQWTVSEGTLPGGLTLSLAGVISGTPAEFDVAPYEFSVTLNDADENVLAASTALRIAVAPPPLVIEPISLPGGTVGVTYPAQSLDVSGGSGSGTWSIGSGNLPPGLTLTGTGQISGTPTSYEGSPFSFTAMFTDADSRVSPESIALGIAIAPPPLVLETTSLPDGTKYESYSAVLTATGARGNYQWSLSSGQLPRGLSLSSDGIISGTAERRQTKAFVVTVTEGPEQISRSFTIKINNRSCDDGDPNHDHPQDCNDDG